jgi:hypothetical protein
LALEVAIENGLECIDELVGTEPQAMETRSMVNYMYPFEQVALVLLPPMEFMASYLVTMWKQKHSLSFTNCCEL